MATVAVGHTGHSSPGSWQRLPKPWRFPQPEPWVSARASPTQLGREREPPWGQTQVWSIPLPPKLCATRILESPLFFKIMSGQNQQTQDKDSSLCHGLQSFIAHGTLLHFLHSRYTGLVSGPCTCCVAGYHRAFAWALLPT